MADDLIGWRAIAAPIIAEAIQACGYPKGCDRTFMRKVLRAEYPFGERAYWPYKVWCSEVTRQLRRAEALGGMQQQLNLADLPLFTETHG